MLGMVLQRLAFGFICLRDGGMGGKGGGGKREGKGVSEGRKVVKEATRTGFDSTYLGPWEYVVLRERIQR